VTKGFSATPDGRLFYNGCFIGTIVLTGHYEEQESGYERLEFVTSGVTVYLSSSRLTNVFHSRIAASMAIDMRQEEYDLIATETKRNA